MLDAGGLQAQGSHLQPPPVTQFQIERFLDFSTESVAG